MFTTRTRTISRASALLVALLFSSLSRAETIVLPNVTGFVLGAQNALWSTEIRITNPSETVRELRVIDWLGVNGALRTLEIQPGETRIVSGWELIHGGHRGRAVRLDEAVFGAAVCEVDDGLLVQSSIQTYTFPYPGGGIGPGGDAACRSWQGGYEIDDVFFNCNPGVGSIITHDRGFFAPEETIKIPWLFASPGFRRQNLVILNPDGVASTVEISITSADGRVTKTNRVTVGPRSHFQINDLFRRPEWEDYLNAIGNQQYEKPAARATIRATTRLYALGYVISWENNTVSVSLPM